MAFFCEASGVRIVAPGIAISAGGTVPEFDHAQPVHEDAERSARAVLAAVPAKDDSEPSIAAKGAALKAAETVLTDPNKSKAAQKAVR